MAAASSSAVNKTFNNKKETNAIYGQKGRGKNDCHQYVGEVLISNHAPVQQQEQGNQRRSDAPRRQFTKIILCLQHYNIC